MKKPFEILTIFLAGTLIVACSVDNSHPASQPSISASKISKSKVLQVHNAVRSRHGLRPFKWSNDLASISQKWANQLGSGDSCKMYHQTGNVPFGENLFISSPTIWSDGRREVGPVSVNEVVNSWASEKKWYNFEKNSCQLGQQCGHYTQLVWKGTKEVGCSLKVCNDKSQVWVCNYFPAGNIIGARPY